MSEKMRSKFAVIRLDLAFFAFVRVGRLTRSLHPIVTEPDATENDKSFFPSGAILFFGLLLLFYAGLWLVIYWLMIARS